MTEVDITMDKSLLKRRLSHLMLRLLVIVNLADLIFGTFYPEYFHVINQFLPGKAVIIWLATSTFLLPLYVGLEVWWMRSIKSEVRELLIDAALVIVWFLTFWGFILYAWTHYAII